MLKMINNSNYDNVGNFQVWSKICYGILCCYISYTIYHPVVFGQLPDVLGFGIVDFHRF